MLLVDFKEEDGWIKSSYDLTYKVSWERILKSVNVLFDFFDQTEIIVDNNILNISKDDILNIAESSKIIIRGASKILGVPLQIGFYNQTKTVTATVASATDEFRNVDYKKFNYSMAQFMDSIEIAMYR